MATRTGFRQAMAELHTWAGLVPGWVLFAIFLTGSLSYFRPEISLWTRPELPVAGLPAPAQVLARAQDRLQQIGAGASRWRIELPQPHWPVAELYVWRDVPVPGDARPRFVHETLDPRTGRPAAARASFGGDFFYYFHFDLHLPWRLGRFIAGFAAMAMLVAIVSGVIIHRRIFADFFTFRPGKGQRSWLDAHNLTGVVALPYHLMIAYTGLVTLMTLYLPWGVEAAYRDRARFFAEAGQSYVPPPAAGIAAPLVPVDGLLDRVQRHWPGEAAGRVDVYWPGDAQARIVYTVDDATRLSHLADRLVFDGASGALLRDGADAVSWPARTERVMYGLHLGQFGGPLLHFLFFLSGLLGTVMVGSGLVLWCVKRRDRHAGVADGGARWAEALNLAVIIGLPVAVAGFFWANRLLPAALGNRAFLEMLGFYLTWVLCGLHAGLRLRQVSRFRAWSEQSAAAAIAFLLLPVLNAITTDAHLGRSLPRGDWGRAGVDLAMLAAGLAFAGLALYLRRRAAATAARPAPAVP